MRVPVSLLKQMVPIPVDLDTLVRVMNARVSEIEHVHRFPSREAFRDVRVVELIEAVERREEHTRWRTTAGFVVAGDKYGVKAGERYAAVIGGALPDGTRVEARKVAGMDSDGALASEAMLGVGKDAARPLRFAPDTPAGADAWAALELDDVVLEFDLEPNRPDLFSLVGMARDVSAIWAVPLAEPPRADLSGLAREGMPKIELKSPRARAYVALAATRVKVGPSPQWLQNAVRKLGMRPINNIVDAANLAMMEIGQPLHTFDRARLKSDRIALRMARPEERITTLDGVERTLTDECLLVCDGDAPVAIAGVMGDATSEVHEDTTDVLIECAAFDMAAVRRASRRLSLRTEASLRFEKGLPVSRVRAAAERLAHLLGQVAGAVPVGLVRAGETSPTATMVFLDRAYIRSRLGMDVDDGEIDRILVALGLHVTHAGVVVPEYRPDLKIQEDLAEEVGRVHGYEHVRAEAPVMGLAAVQPNRWLVAARAARRALTAHGWDEVYLPVWIGDAEVERFGLARDGLIALINPIAENLKYFRPTALPALVEAAVQNRKELDRFALFEVGKVYARDERGAVAERQHLAGIAVGADLLAVRDLLAGLGRALGAGVEVTRTEHLHLHPGRALAVGGWAVAGELHPRLVRAHGLREAPIVLAADLEAVAGLRVPVTRFAPPPRFPSIELDLNVEIGPRVEAARVLAAVPKVDALRSAEVRDVFPLPAGARLTLRLSFNAGDRSLTQEEGLARLGEVRAALAAHGFSPA
ncbi:MAG: phenylalanine--tRNA ligase subunit beta [Myxococcota bacterium]